jgi:hypothetical protein
MNDECEGGGEGVSFLEEEESLKSLDERLVAAEEQGCVGWRKRAMR